jgi:aspartyl-tRNA(Asn)/glutamyl-tRNA(Gln) amidotransferase subunit A
MLNKTALQLRDAIGGKEISSREAVEACLRRIEKLDPQVRAFISFDRDRAIEQAREIDDRLARGEKLGPLAGVPVAIKDNICTRIGRTTCASKILANFASPYDAHVVERLQAAGAVIVGKTNLDEFAMGSSTENSGVQITRNPWDLQRVPGGSSGGSAAATAGRMVPIALGSDTGGSIRLPASFCGVTGLKPTYGRVSRYGLVAYGSSLDQIGPLSMDARDAALMLGIIAGPDPRDSTSAPNDVPDYLAAMNSLPKGLRIGIAKEFFVEGLDSEVKDTIQAALDCLAGLGAAVVDISLPTTPHWLAAYTIVAFAEASSNLSRYDGVHYGHRTQREGDIIDLYCRSRAEGFGTEVKRRIMLGTYTLSSGYYDAYYLKALKVRTLIIRDFQAAFERCDVIAGPVSPTPAFRIGEKTADPLTMYLSDIYTISANLAGLPAISIPCGFSSGGLPIGLQLMGRHFDEVTLLQVADAYQQVTDWHRRQPPLS